MRFFVLLSLALALTACATVDYQPYEGKNQILEGEGGSKLTVDGIDFWANGTPPRKFKILGYVVSEIGRGYGDEAMIRSSVSKEVKAKGGDAAIQVNDNNYFTGLVRTAQNMYIPSGVRQMKFAVISYIN